MDRVLLLGCGSKRDRRLKTPNHQTETFDDCELETVDFVATHKPTYVLDLNAPEWALKANRYDEVHAYEVLEHLGQQGDFVSFFSTFNNIYRILKPGGFLCASVPSVASPWLWGDPGHTRVIQVESLTFLSKAEYKRQVGKTPMSDYRTWLKCDFVPRYVAEEGNTFFFILEALKDAKKDRT
jgi:SAM-dependent methyltransferase